MTLPGPAPQGRQPLTGLGIFCIVVGFIVALPSGLCTATLLAIAGVSLSQEGGLRGFAEDGLPMLFAALAPLVIGIVLIWAGFRLRKST